MNERPKPTPDRHLITSAPLCIDGAEHLGNLVGSMLPADAYARFLRACGESVLFVCATDEHGTAAELAAAEMGFDVAEYCRHRHQVQARLAEEFGLSFDVFGRSSSRQSREQTGYFAKRLGEEGFLEARSMRRGLEARDSRHLFLLQSKLAAQLRVWLDEKDDWPPPARSIALESLDRGLEDRSITRELSWGVPVDRDGYEGQVYDGGFDAPIAYIGATREWADARGEPGAWRRWWRRSEEVRYVQFMAMDSIPFHAVGFPCTLFGSGEAWKLADLIKAFHRLIYYGDEFSTGDERGIFLDQALELLPADCWRYYLLANAPEAGETSFSWEALAAVVNDDLVGAFGGFVSKSLIFSERHFEGEVPCDGDPGPAEAELLRELELRLVAYTERLEALEFRAAIAELRAIWGCGNAYLDREQPWAVLGGEPRDAARTASFCVHLVYLFSRLAAPVIPFAAERILDALGVPEPSRRWPSSPHAEKLPLGHRLSVPPALFPRIGEDDVERWRARFDGAGSVDHEAGLGILEAEAPGGDGREYHREEEQHRQR